MPLRRSFQVPRAARAIRLAIGTLSDYVPWGLPMCPLVASSLYSLVVELSSMVQHLSLGHYIPS
jgi:hypothetical protein